MKKYFFATINIIFKKPYLIFISALYATHNFDYNMQFGKKCFRLYNTGIVIPTRTIFKVAIKQRQVRTGTSYSNYSMTFKINSSIFKKYEFELDTVEQTVRSFTIPFRF